MPKIIIPGSNSDQAMNRILHAAVHIGVIEPHHFTSRSKKLSAAKKSTDEIVNELNRELKKISDRCEDVLDERFNAKLSAPGLEIDVPWMASIKQGILPPDLIASPGDSPKVIAAKTEGRTMIRSIYKQAEDFGK